MIYDNIHIYIITIKNKYGKGIFVYYHEFQKITKILKNENYGRVSRKIKKLGFYVFLT